MHVCAHGTRRPHRAPCPSGRRAHVQSCSAVASSADGTAAARRAPDAFVLPPGELSNVTLATPEANEEVFRCTGCTDHACAGPSGCHATAWRTEEAGYLRSILTARVYDVAIESPLEYARQLSGTLGNEVWLKREDLQPVFSFKLRGAYNKMAKLTSEELAAGVICSSAGNHAQGVALAARELGTTAVICMPTTTPEIKVNSVKALGGEVRLVGESYTETQSYAWQVAAEDGRTFVAPYDDPHTIAGQGTIGMEIMNQLSSAADDLLAVFVPVGGGGLLAGIASYIKAVRPEVKVIGVEPSGANCMAQSLDAGRRVELSSVDAFADGVAVKTVGVETFRLCQKLCDGIVMIDNIRISAAIKDMFTETRSILEPAGALAVAGAKAYLSHYNLQGAKVVAVTSGANMNFDRLRLVADLANFGLRTEAMLAVTIPEKAGSFKDFNDSLLASSNGGDLIDVTEFKYRFSVDREAEILISISGKTRGMIDSALQRLQALGYRCVDITDSPVAQLHLRHMVGGRPRSYSGSIEHEEIVVAQFPEKAGALRQFLEEVTNKFNITLFHYRTTGNRMSSVLLGVQVPPLQRSEFTAIQERLTQHSFRFDQLDNATKSTFDRFMS